mgnify:CR=1 FL=1
MNSRKQIGFLITVLITIVACNSEYVPKPKGFNRLDLAEPSFQSLPDTLPYSFEYSKHAILLKDTSTISDKYWVEVYYPELLADIHITYIELNND